MVDTGYYTYFFLCGLKHTVSDEFVLYSKSLTTVPIFPRPTAPRQVNAMPLPHLPAQQGAQPGATAPVIDDTDLTAEHEAILAEAENARILDQTRKGYLARAKKYRDWCATHYPDQLGCDHCANMSV